MGLCREAKQEANSDRGNVWNCAGQEQLDFAGIANKAKLIPPWVGKRLLRDLVFAIRASRRFGQDELERAVLRDDVGQKPIEWNLGIARMTVLTRFSQFLGPVDHLGPDR